MLFSYDSHPININKDVELDKYFAVCFLLKNGNSTKIDKKIM